MRPGCIAEDENCTPVMKRGTIRGWICNFQGTQNQFYCTIIIQVPRRCVAHFLGHSYWSQYVARPPRRLSSWILLIKIPISSVSIKKMVLESVKLIKLGFRLQLSDMNSLSWIDAPLHLLGAVLHGVPQLP